MPLLMLPTIEPITANNGGPAGGGDVCADDLGGADNVEVPPDTPLLTTDTVAARTEVLCATDDPTPDTSPANNDECEPGFNTGQLQTDSSAVVEDLGVLIPGLNITVTAAETSAHASCQDGVAVLEGDSQLVGLTINGTPIELPEDEEPVNIDLGLIQIFINERVGTEGALADGATSGSLTRRALRVLLPNIAEVVVAESTVDLTGDACPEGRIVIRKQTAPETPNATDFAFDTTGGLAPPSFQLQDDGEISFDDLAAGSYTVTEQTPVAPYELALLECADPSGDSSTSVELRTATINLAGGETVTCGFVNAVGDTSVICPPGTVPTGDLTACIISNVQCPPGTVLAQDPVRCVITDTQCPEGTQLNLGTFTCVPTTGGQIVPIGDVRGNAKSPCRASRFGNGFAIIGTNGVDRLTGSNSSDAIFAFGGKDRVSGGRGNDCVEGGSGADKLDGSNGDDRLRGGSGNDIVESGPGADTLEGGSGRDNLVGANGRDVMRGGKGNDKIGGGLGVDRIFGGPGTDRIAGGQGKDVIKGGPGRDIINVAIVGPPTRVDCGPGKRDNVRLNRNELGRIKNCEFVDIVTRIFD